MTDKDARIERLSMQVQGLQEELDRVCLERNRLHYALSQIESVLEFRRKSNA